MEINNKKPLSQIELDKILSGVFCYGVVSGEDDGIFYPAYYSRYTGDAHTLLDCIGYDSRDGASKYAKKISTAYILSLHLKDNLREKLKNI